MFLFNYKRNKFSLPMEARTRVMAQVKRTQLGQLGFSIIEILVVVAILALLGLAILFAVRMQMSRARDAQRKTDLNKLKTVFENYYNDNGCYPPVDIFFNGGNGPDANICNQPLAKLQPYLNAVPCDPESGMPYAYYSPNGKTVCEGYRLYTKLEDKKDQSIARVGCEGTGCGNLTEYNYGVSVGANLADTGVIAPTATPVPGAPSPVPTGYLGTWVCSPDTDPAHNGVPYCKEYTTPQTHGCGASFVDLPTCNVFCYKGTPITCND